MACESVAELAEAYYETYRQGPSAPLSNEQLEALRRICLEAALLFHRGVAKFSLELRARHADNIRQMRETQNSRIDPEKQRPVPSEDWLPALRTEDVDSVLLRARASAIAKMHRECVRAGLPLQVMRNEAAIVK